MSGKKHDAEKARYWERTIREAACSGISIQEFCRQRKLQKSQFYWWRRRLEETRQRPTMRTQRVRGEISESRLQATERRAQIGARAGMCKTPWPGREFGAPRKAAKHQLALDSKGPLISPIPSTKLRASRRIETSGGPDIGADRTYGLFVLSALCRSRERIRNRNRFRPPNRRTVDRKICHGNYGTVYLGFVTL
jgi:hypothetical protein